MIGTLPMVGGGPVDLNGPGHYLHWGVIQISERAQPASAHPIRVR